MLRLSPKLWRMAHQTKHFGAWDDPQIKDHHAECLGLLRRELFPIPDR